MDSKTLSRLIKSAEDASAQGATSVKVYMNEYIDLLKELEATKNENRKLRSIIDDDDWR